MQKSTGVSALIKNLKPGSVRIQHRLLMYWISMVFAIFSILMVLLSIAGVFSGSDKELKLALTTQQDNTVAAFNTQVSRLTAQSISVSRNASDMVKDLLLNEPLSSLNDNPELLMELERKTFSELNIALRSNPCNGAFLLWDATINTAAENAKQSRAGVYIRYANLNDVNNFKQDITFYRGISDIARENHLELHNRWKLEFDSSKVVGYEKVMTPTDGRLADKIFWTGRISLTDTWEHTNIMMTPVEADDGSVIGVCGLELSDLYFRLSYPAHETSFGHMVTVIAPIRDGKLCLSEGMNGSLEGTYLYDIDSLTVKEGKNFYSYSDDQNNVFLGLQTRLDMNTLSGDELYAVTFLSEESYLKTDSYARTIWLIGTLCLLAITLAATVYLSRRFAQPIAETLEAIQAGSSFEAETPSGITEIDALLRYIRTKSKQTDENVLPPDMAELFNTFSAHAANLTPTERSIIKYYADGKEINEVAELAFISINTVRKHNANIYQKLGVGSRDELMLYIELFRRCNRLDELF